MRNFINNFIHNSEHRTLNVLLLIAVFVGVCILVVGGYSSFTSQYKNTLSSPPEFNPVGELMFSIATFPLHTDEYGNIMTLSYDFATKGFNIPNPDKPGTLEYEYRIVSTTSKPWVMFVRASDLTGTLGGISRVPFEVYRVFAHYVPWNEIDKKIDEAPALTNDPTTEKQFPEIAHSGDVIYMSRPIAGEKGINPEDWTVHYVPNAGEDTAVDRGMYPKWVNDDNFLFLKSDGLYTYSIGFQEEKQVWKANYTLAGNATLYVSDDGQYVAVADPNIERVYILETNNLRDDTLKLKGTLPLSGSFPVISPDNHYLAIVSQTVTPQGAEIPVIKFANIDTLQVVNSATFSLEGLFKGVSDKIDAYVASTSPKGNIPHRPQSGNVNDQYIVLDNWMQTLHHK